MKVLIIGGTGNISTPITRRLAENGCELTLLNNDTRSFDFPGKVKIIHTDRSCYADFEKQTGELGIFDCVIDMVCYDPEEAASDVRAFKGKTEQLILCSTVDVYTKTPKCYPVTEDGEIDAKPSFPYAYKKMLCERILWDAHSRGDFQLTVLRPTFTYNERWSPGIHAFGGQSYHLDRLRKGKPVILHGDGLGVWVATYCTDTAGAFVGAVGNKKAFGQAYNISSDEWMSHYHIWVTIAELLNAPFPDFVYIPTEMLGKLAPKEAEWCVENFRYNNIFDNSKAKRDLGYRYTIPFREGAQKCITCLDENNLIENSDQYPFYDRIVEAWRRMENSLVEELH